VPRYPSLAFRTWRTVPWVVRELSRQTPQLLMTRFVCSAVVGLYLQVVIRHRRRQ